MSKKPPKAKKQARTAELIEARVLREREWCWQAYVAGYPYPVISTMSGLPESEGGLGRMLHVSAVKTLVAQYRAEQGEIIGTREERIERRQMRLDALGLQATQALTAPSEITVDMDSKERREQRIAEARWRGDAAKLLLDVMAAEGKMHGDDAALRIEAEVTTRDGVLDELNASLAMLGMDPVEKVE